MKILISSNSFWNLYNFRFSLINKLINLNYTVILVAPDDEFVKKFTNLNCKIYKISLFQNKISIYKDCLLFLDYVKILRIEKPEYILSFTIKPNIYLSFASLFSKSKIINTITGLGTMFVSKNIFKHLVIILYKLSLKKSHFVFFHNNYDFNYFLKLKIVNKDNSKSIFGSGVNLKKFLYMPLKKKLNNKIIFLYFGRVLKEKGINELIMAAKYIKKYHPNVIFQIVGNCDAKNKSSLSRSYLQNLSKQNIIKYFAYTKNINEYISNSDCVILPSYREGFPKSLLESSAVGRAMLVSNIPGSSDIVTENFNGFLFKTYDYKDIVKSIEKFISLSYNQRYLLSNNAHRRAVNNFDENLIINEYTNLID